MPRALLPILLLFLGLAWAPVPTLAQQDVTIYRCTGSAGKLTLRDSPCAKGETQDMRTMQRPKDPPLVGTRVPATPAPTATAPPPREVQVIYRTPPRPMYECVDGQGERYTSDDDQGNPRWVPLWTLGYPGWPHRSRGSQPLVPPVSAAPGITSSFSTAPHGRPPVAGVVVPVGGRWVRDACLPLPQQEVCSRLSDRRWEIIRRYNSAGTSERRQLDLEQRGIDARLSNDCGIN